MAPSLCTTPPPEGASTALSYWWSPLPNSGNVGDSRTAKVTGYGPNNRDSFPGKDSPRLKTVSVANTASCLNRHLLRAVTPSDRAACLSEPSNELRMRATVPRNPSVYITRGITVVQSQYQDFKYEGSPKRYRTLFKFIDVLTT